MATTGFWPVKGSLRAVVEYANNPDKTTDSRYLDDDLARTLEYAANDSKTDRKMYVSGINCAKSHAYEDMLAVQRRFGLRGSNVAYHGYQSFKPDEITPELAHEIGKETARRMWGDKYQVLVTTHLNTDSIHNHLVVNAVSHVDGKKFQNHISDHIRLREISDRVCLENRLSVLEDAPFYNSEKKAYWIHRKGQKTHRDILKEDIEECIKLSFIYDDFYSHLYERGYEYDYKRHSVKASSWDQSVRLDRMGYSRENIREMILKNSQKSIHSFAQSRSYHPDIYRSYPLLQLEKKWQFEIEHSHDAAAVALDLVFLILLELLKLAAVKPEPGVYRPKPLSPELRLECARLDEITAQATLLGQNGIHTQTELEVFIQEKSSTIEALEIERQQCWNRLKTVKSSDSAKKIKAEAKDITARIKPLRKDLKTAKMALERAEHYRKLGQVEYAMEKYALDQERSHSNRNLDRSRDR